MRLPEQPGEGKPENEKKGDGGALGRGEEPPRSQAPDFPTWEKMPFHHVTAGLLYKGNYLNRSLSAGSDSEQLANISVEELDGRRGSDPRGNADFDSGRLHMRVETGVLLSDDASCHVSFHTAHNDSWTGSCHHCRQHFCGPQRRLGEIREAFRVLDRDGNGFISKQELGMAMRSLGYMPSEVELAIIMQRLDMDGDGQVDFDEFMTILGPKLVSSEGRDGFLGNTIDSIFWQFDMQRITLEELKHILYHAFRDHLTMKDIENIIINEEESLNETSGNCQTEFEGVHSQKQNRQTCVRKSLICAFAMAFIISVMLIAANQILRSGME
ncbi:PREDICTED: calcium-binding protein 8 isoform X2 [Rhinopithecus bieti]|uniref:calcium-binding protein 8 isoform X2 n=1 Tax=Rhinopithecus bieti TaxID=61621 RepID=UPI00083BBE16|nr:PREDICTED: calcium-binding protein 8 isoform X2 [Rhinopithecus bieti]